MITYLLLIIFISIYLGLFAIRSLRWLGYVQQKEYRADRLQSFLSSSEGKEEIFKLLPSRQELTRAGLKRPRITLRAALTAGFLGIMVFSLLTIGFYWWISVIWMLSLWLAGVYILIPVLAIVAAMPTSILVKIRITGELKRAADVLKQHQPIIIGVGGSYGKTTTKFFIQTLLKEKYSVFTTPHSYNTAYSVARSICNGYSGQDIAILEYGAYKVGEIDKLTSWLQPSLAVITGLTEQHLSLFGSMDSSVLAESELVSAIPENGKVYFNAADKGAEHIVMVGSQGKSLKTIPYQVKDEIKKLKLDKHGRLQFEFGGEEIKTKIVGSHYGENMAGAIAVAKDFEITDKDIIRAFEKFFPNDNFVRSYKKDSGAWILDDSGTSNPVGFAATIKLAESFPEKKKVLITPGIVDLGHESDNIHQQLAASARKVFNEVLYVGVDGREQFTEEFADKLYSQREVIEDKIRQLQTGELLVIEGKMPGWVQELI